MRIQSIANSFVSIQKVAQHKSRNTVVEPETETTQNPIDNINSYLINFRGVTRYTTHFSKEIAEQPKVLKNIIDNFFSQSNKISGINIDLNQNDILKATAINIVASGSSKNAGEMSKSFIEKMLNLPVNIFSASEFMTSSPQINRNDIMIFVSQSGNTADTLEALKYAKNKNIKTIALTNNPKSKISQNAHFSVDMMAGEENAVAATKTVTSSIVNLWGIGLKLAEIKGGLSLNSEKDKKIVEQMKALPEKIQEMIDDKLSVHKLAKKYADIENFYILGKEPNVGATNEGALKLTETTQKRIISGSSSEFMHGLFTSIKPNDLFIEIANGNNQESCKLAVENFQEIINKRQVKNAILFKDANNTTLEKEFSNVDFVNIPETIQDFAPLLNTIRLQQLTEGITKELNINPDNGGGVLTKYRSSLTMNNL